MNVPFCDLSREAQMIPVADAVQDVLASGRFLFGPHVEAFEQELAEWHGVRYAVGVASGTDAVEIALRACHPVGDLPVTLPAFTAVPTINAVEAAGYTPKLFDVDMTANAQQMELTVHLFGQATAGVWPHAVEDCAHAMGARYGGRLVGTMGMAGALSFYPTKILGACGDGGAIITDEPEVYARARQIRHYGFEDSGDIQARGQNSRLSEIQAAILRVKLTFVHEWIRRRMEIATRYDQELGGRVMFVARENWSTDVRHVYVIRHPERDRIAAALRERGIGTMIHYPKALHQYARWHHLGEPRQFPNAERLAREVLSLPCYPYLREDEQEAVIAAVKEVT